MKHLWLTAKLDIVESLRARWFLIYSVVFGGIVALLFAFGLTESRVLGFIRDAVIARIFGAGAVTDAFFVAFRLPNLLRP